MVPAVTPWALLAQVRLASAGTLLKLVAAG
jgi:hypothetical protein